MRSAAVVTAEVLSGASTARRLTGCPCSAIRLASRTGTHALVTGGHQRLVHGAVHHVTAFDSRLPSRVRPVPTPSGWNPMHYSRPDAVIGLDETPEVLPSGRRQRLGRVRGDVGGHRQNMARTGRAATTGTGPYNRENLGGQESHMPRLTHDISSRVTRLTERTTLGKVGCSDTRKRRCSPSRRRRQVGSQGRTSARRRWPEVRVDALRATWASGRGACRER